MVVRRSGALALRIEEGALRDRGRDLGAHELDGVLDPQPGAEAAVAGLHGRQRDVLLQDR